MMMNLFINLLCNIIYMDRGQKLSLREMKEVHKLLGHAIFKKEVHKEEQRQNKKLDTEIIFIKKKKKSK